MTEALNYLFDSYKAIIKELVSLFNDNGIESDDILNAIKLNKEEKQLFEEIIEEES